MLIITLKNFAQHNMFFFLSDIWYLTLISCHSCSKYKFSLRFTFKMICLRCGLTKCLLISHVNETIATTRNAHLINIKCQNICHDKKKLINKKSLSLEKIYYFTGDIKNISVLIFLLPFLEHHVMEVNMI